MVTALRLPDQSADDHQNLRQRVLATFSIQPRNEPPCHGLGPWPVQCRLMPRDEVGGC